MLNNYGAFTGRVVLCACLSLLAPAASLGEDQVPEPAGYKLEDYDSPVPEGLTGAVRVTAVEVLKLQQEAGAIIIDVIPEHRKPDSLPAGQLWLPPAHIGVKGAVWLPDVGYGVLSDTTSAYFRTSLAALSNSDPDQALVFYCRINCWMSWNAAKRAIEWGYRNIYWFADGLDEWQFEDYPVEALKPRPGVRH